MKKYYLGVDIGGTSVKLALMDADCRILERAEASVSFDRYRTPVQATVLREAAAFLERLDVKPEGIGISATGQISSAGVVIGSNGSIPGWEDCDLRSLFAERWSVPVVVLNDANAAALGEWRLGSGRGCTDMLMVTLGTGVGGGIISGGRLLTGSRGLAGELGHFVFHRDGRPCTCGLRGCFEQYASTAALLRRVEAETGQSMTGRELFQEAEAGNQPLREIIDGWTEEIAAGLAGLVHLFNPERVVLGGGISTQRAQVIDPVRQKLLRLVMPRFAEHLTVVPAMLGNDAGVVGAVCELQQEEQADEWSQCQ